MTYEKNENVRFQYLDAMRGVAAVSVCFHHLLNYIYQIGTMGQATDSFINSYILESFDFGRFGVVLFFLISGFIIPTSLKPGATLKKFAVTRIFRLYPAFWIACLLIFLTSPLLFNQNIPTYQFLANLTMVPKLLHSPELSGVFWTLFVEILFYLGCATLFRARLLENPVMIGAIALALHAVTPLVIILNNQFHTGLAVRFLPYHLSFLFIGNVLRLAINNRNRSAQMIAAFLVGSAFISAPIMTGLFFNVPEATASDFVMHGAKATTYSYFLAIAIFLLVSITKYGFNRWTADLGKISYSLYLLHMLCFVAVAKIIPPTTPWTCLLYIILSALLAFVAAKVSFKAIEEPAIGLGRRAFGSARMARA